MFIVLFLVGAALPSARFTGHIEPVTKTQQSKNRPKAKPQTAPPGNDLKPLEITHFSHSSGDGWLGAGSGIRVSLRGTPGMEAFFDIPGLVHSVPMKESSPGTYTARYVLPSNKPSCLSRARIFGGLRDAKRFSQPAAAAGPLRLDLAPPVIEEIYPRPSAGVVRPRVPILARVTDHLGSGIAAERTRLILDQEDRTDGLVASGSTFLFQPGEELEPGEHSAHLMVYDRAGNMKSQSWTFNVRDTGGAIHAIITNAERITGPGDVLTVNVEGMWDSRATLVIGDSKEIPMKEQSPGFYDASYVLQPSDVAAEIPLAVTMAVPGQPAAVEAIEHPIRLPAPAAPPPSVTNPPEMREGGLIAARGKGGPRSHVLAGITYRLRLNGREEEGSLAEQVLRVPSPGAWEIRPMPASPILMRAGAVFKAAAVPYTASPESQDAIEEPQPAP